MTWKATKILRNHITIDPVTKFPMRSFTSRFIIADSSKLSFVQKPVKKKKSIQYPCFFLCWNPTFRIYPERLFHLRVRLVLFFVRSCDRTRRHHANLYITSAITCRHKSHRQIKFWRDSLADINFGIQPGEMAVTRTCVRPLSSLASLLSCSLSRFPPPPPRPSPNPPRFSPVANDRRLPLSSRIFIVFPRYMYTATSRRASFVNRVDCRRNGQRGHRVEKKRGTNRSPMRKWLHRSTSGFCVLELRHTSLGASLKVEEWRCLRLSLLFLSPMTTRFVSNFHYVGNNCSSFSTLFISFLWVYIISELFLLQSLCINNIAFASVNIFDQINIKKTYWIVMN